MTLHPSLANSNKTYFPIPVFPPVITAFLPTKQRCFVQKEGPLKYLLSKYKKIIPAIKYKRSIILRKYYKKIDFNFLIKIRINNPWNHELFFFTTPKLVIVIPAFNIETR